MTGNSFDYAVAVAILLFVGIRLWEAVSMMVRANVVTSQLQAMMPQLNRIDKNPKETSETLRVELLGG